MKYSTDAQTASKHLLGFHTVLYISNYAAINAGEVPLKILQLSDMRWLAVSVCLNGVLD